MFLNMWLVLVVPNICFHFLFTFSVLLFINSDLSSMLHPSVHLYFSSVCVLLTLPQCKLKVVHVRMKATVAGGWITPAAPQSPFPPASPFSAAVWLCYNSQLLPQWSMFSAGLCILMSKQTRGLLVCGEEDKEGGVERDEHAAGGEEECKERLCQLHSHGL